MKKYSLFFIIPLVILCFIVIFSFGSKTVQKRNEEIAEIHHSAEAVIRDYLKGQKITGVLYNSLPIHFDKDRCILGCRVDTVDQFGVKRRTGFDVLFRRKKKTWKAAIVTVEKNLPVSKAPAEITP